MSERSEQLRYCFCHGNIILTSLTCELFKHKIGYSGSNTARSSCHVLSSPWLSSHSYKVPQKGFF